MERSERKELFDLATRHGVQTSYIDIEGVEQTASPERLVQVLRALGLPIEGPADAPGLAQRELHARWHRRIEPVVVAWDGRGSVVVRSPASVATSDYRLCITTEEGQVLEATGNLERGTVVDDTVLDGRSWVARRLPLPENLPIGYHTLEVELRADGSIDRALLLCAPRRVYTPSEPSPDGTGTDASASERARTWGVFVPLYALHSERSAGVGDLTDLRHVIDWVGDRGGSVVGTLPLLAAFLDDPFEPSPYAPVSRLAWNEIYLDPAALPEVREVASSSAKWQQVALANRRAMAKGDFVDFAAVMASKRTILEAAAQRCFEAGGRRCDALEAFRRARPEIDAYARFRAVGERLRCSWPQWPERLRAGQIDERDFEPRAYRHHLYAQWNVHEQLLELSTRARATGLGLYLDLPIGVHAHGFDTWREPEAFVGGLSTGAPPDTLFAGGQNWAFPPLHPTRLRDGHYRHLIAVLRNHLRYAGVLRIDHVMGLHRLYVIPDGAPATEGVYIRQRPDELYAILSIESHRAKAVLIGENLGTVPPAVQHAMDTHGVHGMHVVQYAVRPDAERALPPASAGEVASLNTHDMPPFHAFWHGHDIDQRRELGWIDDAQVDREHTERRATRAALRRFLGEEVGLGPDADASETSSACLKHLARSDARLVLVTLEDLWGETRSQNVPGTWREHPNWCRRATHAFEAWREMPAVTEVLRTIDRTRRLALRRPTVSREVARIGDEDVLAWREGTHAHMGELLGAHPTEHEGQSGTDFAVWAPSAESVSVIGDWTGWAPDRCPLHRRGDTGIWDGFIAGIEPGDTYKVHLRRAGNGPGVDKADPFAVHAELAPRSASIVATLDYAWGDEAWLRRRDHGLERPVSIYEVHLGSWRRVPEERDRVLGYRESARLLAEHVERLGFTHVQLMPITEHPAHDPWGQTPTGLFAPTSRYGPPRDLMALVDHLHQRDIGVILDWAPWGLSSVGHGLARFDGSPLFERPDRDVFDLRRPEVRSFLTSSACHWLERFHFDGLRIDVSESMLSTAHDCGEVLAFLRHLNETLYRRNPGIATIAQAGTPWPMVSRPTYVGGLGFGYRWDSEWREQIMQYMARDPIFRRHHHEVLSTRGAHASSENAVLALPHDCVAGPSGSLAAQMPGDAWQKLANLRLLYGYMWTQPGKKHLFMGQELGQWSAWSADRSLDWHLLDQPAHRGVLQWVADLNRIYRSERALYELDGQQPSDGLDWIEAHDAEHSVLCYLRRGRGGDDDTIVVLCNFTPIVRHGYRVGVPHGGTWYELLNSDAEVYGGSGVGNAGRVEASAEPSHGRSHSIGVTLPPLGVLVLGRRPR